jgi:predicted alpha/beta hydrolase family esterase
MKTVIFHGTDGSPDGNWFPWLKTELEKLGHEVFVPKMPTPDNQSVDTWVEATHDQLPFKFDSDTILIGHSLGATWILDALSYPPTKPVKASFLVSGFLEDLGDEFFDSHNHTFTHFPIDWEKVRTHAGKITIFHGDNDPYVPTAQAEKLAKKLGVKPIFIKNGGHLNAESGYTKFPELLKMIKEIEK